MAEITRWIEVWDDRQGKTASDGSRTYRRSFVVETDDARISGDQIRFYNQCPKPGDVYISSIGAFDPWAFCQDVTVNPNKSPYHWKVTASYSTAAKSSPASQPSGGPGAQGGQSGGAERIEDPLARPPEVSFATREYMEVARLDADGIAIQNSRGDPFDPPVEKPSSILTMTVSRNLAIINPLMIGTYMDTVNDRDWLIFPEFCVRCARLVANGVWEAGREFWKVTGEFEYKSQGWIRQILDAGWREGAGDGTAIKDKQGHPLSVPAMLNGHGMKLPYGDDPVYLSFDMHKAKDFRTLNFFRELGS